jgi:hypothetical protein
MAITALQECCIWMLHRYASCKGKVFSASNIWCNAKNISSCSSQHAFICVLSTCQHQVTSCDSISQRATSPRSRGKSQPISWGDSFTVFVHCHWTLISFCNGPKHHSFLVLFELRLLYGSAQEYSMPRKRSSWMIFKLQASSKYTQLGTTMPIDIMNPDTFWVFFSKRQWVTFRDMRESENSLLKRVVQM